jgi:hypothetical protein
MALALIPLIGRATCITISFTFDPFQVLNPPPLPAGTPASTVRKVVEDHIIARKLLLPSRIFYALLYVAIVHVIPKTHDM